MKNLDKNKSYPFLLNGLAAVFVGFYLSMQFLLSFPFSLNSCQFGEFYLHYEKNNRRDEFLVGQPDTIGNANKIYFNTIPHRINPNYKCKVWYYKYSKSNSSLPDDRAKIAQVEQRGVMLKRYSYWKAITSSGLMVLFYSFCIIAFIYVVCWIGRMIKDTIKSRRNENAKKANSDSSSEQISP